VIATYVDPQRTRLTFDQAATSMRAALENPPDHVLALALAKSALETGRWDACWNWNLGNQKAGPTYAGMYTCITLNEVLDGKVVWFAPHGQLSGGPSSTIVGEAIQVPPGHPQTRMRAYAGPTDGAYAYVDFVGGSKRYAAAWQALLRGEPSAYVHELKRAGYFTAPEEPYRKAVARLHTEYVAKLAGREHAVTADDTREWAALRAQVQAFQADYARQLLDENRDTDPAELSGDP
jgi:hypothetical protein